MTDDSAGRPVHRQRMTDGGRFALRYRHSVEKSPVEEIYEVAADGAIYLVETTVEASGYGLPECAPGQDCVTRDGRVTFRGLHRRIDHLVMRVSYLNDMWLIFDNVDLNLRRVAAAHLLHALAQYVTRADALIAAGVAPALQHAELRRHRVDAAGANALTCAGVPASEAICAASIGLISIPRASAAARMDGRRPEAVFLRST